MHHLRLLLLAGLLAGTGLAATTTEPPVPVVPTTINVPSAVTELAGGYAAAAQRMSLKSLVIYIKGDDKVSALKGIRSVQSLGGVVLVTFSGGDLLAVNAEKVVLITDGTRTP